MAKSLRSKKKKRLRTLRREIAQPFYDKKDEAKIAALEAALAAPKLEVRNPPPSSSSMEVDTSNGGANDNPNSNSMLKPGGGIQKTSKKGWKLRKEKRRKKHKKQNF
ncbi:uncharacterized protein LOC18443205 [Amborella trichopoda]|uniref:Uncharacterized protein n=1 Tax=Amborella trichopoda TaxID=13333 RepID=U5CP31_AMBTC|nr:uncharacterized protein LOC18443205 [Amborella trichopoda]ERN14926.1 hypothetical protein AMTR_s00032p00193010 [Amborella trichopoda]|eukprot:XP_006853459.1 uncharacterized protein LOC18443205 [Amborella trichopoda]